MLLDEINAKVSFYAWYLHQYTKIYLKLNRNQNAQRWIDNKVPSFICIKHEKNVQQN